jgi:NADH/NAD ratio-sensing transcriptional regulator Rex
MPKGHYIRKNKDTHEINGVKMSKLKHDRIRAFEAMLPQLDERERLNSEDVASRLGVSGVTICSWLKVLGRRLMNNNGRTFYSYDKSQWHKTVLPIYKKTGSSEATAKAVGINPSSIYRWLSNNGHLVRKYRERDISKFKFQSYR